MNHICTTDSSTILRAVNVKIIVERFYRRFIIIALKFINNSSSDSRLRGTFWNCIELANRSETGEMRWQYDVTLSQYSCKSSGVVGSGTDVDEYFQYSILNLWAMSFCFVSIIVGDFDVLKTCRTASVDHDGRGCEVKAVPVCWVESVNMLCHFQCY